MNNLDRIIGPAPSELPWEELRAKIGIERDRVREAIDWWRAGGGAKASHGRTKTEPGFSNRELKLMAKTLGVSLAELNVLLAKAAKEKQSASGEAQV